MNSSIDSPVVLVREAGVPFETPPHTIEPFADWLSLMEVVQMLCPQWAARDAPILGSHWKL